METKAPKTLPRRDRRTTKHNWVLKISLLSSYRILNSWVGVGAVIYLFTIAFIYIFPLVKSSNICWAHGGWLKGTMWPAFLTWKKLKKCRPELKAKLFWSMHKRFWLKYQAVRFNLWILYLILFVNCALRPTIWKIILSLKRRGSTCLTIIFVCILTSRRLRLSAFLR